MMREPNHTAEASTSQTKKHSPAPFQTGPINYADIYDSNGDLVALVIKDRPSTGADAALFTAAPDLLEALKQVNEWLLDTEGPIERRDLWNPMFLRAYDTARAAIAKATGAV